MNFKFMSFYQNIVIYWPSTEPSIKRCTWVNKQKNSGSRWALNNNITRAQTAWVSWRLDVSEVRPSGRQRALGSQWPMVEQHSQDKKEVLLGQYSSLSPSPAHLSHTTNITLSRIKYERYIFIKKCVRSFIEVCHYCWFCSAYICICMWLYNNGIISTLNGKILKLVDQYSLVAISYLQKTMSTYT